MPFGPPAPPTRTRARTLPNGPRNILPQRSVPATTHLHNILLKKKKRDEHQFKHPSKRHGPHPMGDSLSSLIWPDTTEHIICLSKRGPGLCLPLWPSVHLPSSLCSHLMTHLQPSALWYVLPNVLLSLIGVSSLSSPNSSGSGKASWRRQAQGSVWRDELYHHFHA